MRILIVTIILIFSLPAQSAQNAIHEQERLYELTQQLRCLVCQNQTLADSNAAFAVDLRQEITILMAKSYSDKEIIDYLTQRYGQFILYKPALNKQTWLLWFAPFILLLIGFGVLWHMIAKGRQ